MSSGVKPDQDRQSVGSDLDSNYLHRLSADCKSRSLQGKNKATNFVQ